MSAYCKAHYAKNASAHNARRIASDVVYQSRNQAYVEKYLATHTCIDCGASDPIVLEFDHLRDKSFSIGSVLPRNSWQSILDEIAKCEVVCANCHRKRTAFRRGTMKAILAAQDKEIPRE